MNRLPKNHSRRRIRLTTLRLVREGTFSPPEGYPETRVAIRFPRDVFDFMSPYAAREVAESFWILPLDSQHRLIGQAPTVITRGILNSSVVHP
ncbi:MAG TPA: JAB domain-containing protein, partial [Gemmatimonadaceae bacterium]|nr:JAB domain-containing protein [Gemmatimonadaceae bacterium]